MALDNTEDLGVIILPYSCKLNDPRLKDLGKSEWEKAKELVLSIQPKFTIRRDSRISYPRAVCLFGSNFTLRQSLYPWDPMKVEFFVCVQSSPPAILNERLSLMTMQHQTQRLPNASIIRERGGGRHSNEQKAFRAAIISQYGLEHPDNPNVPDTDTRYRCQLTGIHFPSEMLKASCICPVSENGIASPISLRNPMDHGIRMCEGEELSPPIRWSDLYRQRVKFSTSSEITPLKRALHWHAQNARYHLHRSKYAQGIDLPLPTFAPDLARESADSISSGLSSFGSPSQIKIRQSWVRTEISIKSETALPPALYVSSPASLERRNRKRNSR
ncbi:hypothetical protein TWF703_005202 [Orbilia oligospora]|uniref:Uncharacterized protein n=1 Tax=Orbilia oligospora TaxID=2813651 RepID=A0A7C8JSQ9_ORBOL|nr:hypothetical protein TWF703_005202 [Orbilia oligospora]